MNKNVIFVCGVHGSGKSTIAKELAEKIGIPVISSGELINGSLYSSDKTVFNVPGNQEKLIQGLHNFVSKMENKNGNFILDGHTCILGSDREIIQISLDIFKKIGVGSIVLIFEEPRIIKDRLWERDKKEWGVEMIARMQSAETSYAHIIADELDVPFTQIRSTEFDKNEDVILLNLE